MNVLDPFIHSIEGKETDYDVLMDHIADARVVLLGEATHGTQEFYAARAEITKRLITEKKFTVIGIEGDWPDTYRVNRFIHHKGSDKNAAEALADYKRFPAWMWRNKEFASLVQWLRTYNQGVCEKSDVIDIFGLDVYSLHRSIEIIISELEKIDLQAAKEARSRYACFDAYQDPQEYGYISSLFLNKTCHSEVMDQFIDLKNKEISFFKNEDMDPEEEKFYIEQNALVIKNAEEYYRSLFGQPPSVSWNIRDRHMMQTVSAIEQYKKETTGQDAKIIIWAHNSHVGDARGTQMASYGQINIGQLAKELYGAGAISVGFTMYTGTVSAASAWGGNVERKYVQPAFEDSIESFFHLSDKKAFYIALDEDPAIYQFFDTKDYLQRAIGVVYLPQVERHSHYFSAEITRQFDVIIHFDVSHAVEPFDKSTEWQEAEDAPETFPFGV